jgi:glycosyltransferase involved in cell wall biosynthesis
MAGHALVIPSAIDLQVVVAHHKVSVILPVFNAARYLQTAIKSLLGQTLSDWELVTVEDGSTDGSDVLLQTFADSDQRIRVIHQPHRGIVAALNVGISEARNDLIARMDADDWAYPTRLERQTSFLGSHPEIGLVGSLVEFGGNQNLQTGYALHVNWLNSIVTPDEIALNRFVESPFAHPSILFRRELIARHGGYHQGDFPEDYELILRWLDAGVNMAKICRVLLRWNDPPDRLSRTDLRYRTASFYQTKAFYLARWLMEHGLIAHRDGSPRTDSRPILVWGAGRVTLRRVEFLEAHSVPVAGFIDINLRKHGRRRDGRTVIGPEEIPPPNECFVLGYVAKRGARQLIRDSLGSRGFVEGCDFLLAA